MAKRKGYTPVTASPEFVELLERHKPVSPAPMMFRDDERQRAATELRRSNATRPEPPAGRYTRRTKHADRRFADQ